jgi:DNA-binding response OmpR family regulator
MSHHLLIIEDEEGLREGLRRNFEFEGYRVSTAADGVVGLEAALTLKPDLVILDIMLPAMSGFEVCRRIRGSALDLCILILTVRRNEADRAKGLRMGADDYLVKPFNLQELSSRVKALLERRSSPDPSDG